MSKIPRLFTAQKVMTSCGGGWAEFWLRATEEDDEYKYGEPVGFCKGNFVLEDGSNGPIIPDEYNHQYGMRIWTAKPDKKAREAMPWDG